MSVLYGLRIREVEMVYCFQFWRRYLDTSVLTSYIIHVII